MEFKDNLPAIIRGRVAWVFPDDFDVDNIIGVKNIRCFDISFLKTVCMNNYVDCFSESVAPGDLLVGGRNFGYGHPHYQAMTTMRSLGITTILADSFAPGFYRGELFNGMLLLTCPLISNYTKRWDEITINWKEGKLLISGNSQQLNCEKLSPHKEEIIRAGGKYNLLLSKYGNSPVRS